MKTTQLFITFSLFLISHYSLFAQTDSTIVITGDSTICKGGTLTLVIKPSGDIFEEYIWSKVDGGVLGNGDTIKITIDESDTSEFFVIKCRAVLNDTTTISTTKKIVIEKGPVLNTPISSFQLDNNIFLEVKISENEEYFWKSPNGVEVKGNIAKFPDVKLSDFGIYQLKIKNIKTGCSSEFEYLVELDKKEETQNVFGTLEENNFSNLYKEITRDVPVYECDIIGLNKSSNFLIAKPGYQFTIISEIENDYIIRFWRRKEKKENKDSVEYIVSDKYLIKYILIDHLVNGRITSVDKKQIFKTMIVIEVGHRYNSTTTDSKGKFILNVKELPAQLFLVERSPEVPEDALEIGSPSPESRYFATIMDKKVYNNLFVTKINGEDGLIESRYFRINKSDVENRSISFSPSNFRNGFSFTAGTVIIPIKIRNSKELDEEEKGFEFSKDIALGPYIGLKYRISKYKPYFVSAGGTVGISSVRLTSSNSNPALTPTVQDYAAFTWGLGAIFEFDNVQIGFFTGKDKINNNFMVNDNPGYNWAYQNKWWWSIGFGYAIISRPVKAKKGVEEAE